MSDREQYKIMIENDVDFVIDKIIEKNNELTSQQVKIEELQTKLQQKENIINELKERSLQYSEEIDRLLDMKNEVREYIEKASYFQGNKILEEKELLEILDKK